MQLDIGKNRPLYLHILCWNKTASLKIAIPAASYGVLRDFFPAGSAAFEKHPAACGWEYNPQRFKLDLTI